MAAENGEKDAPKTGKDIKPGGKEKGRDADQVPFKGIVPRYEDVPAPPSGEIAKSITRQKGQFPPWPDADDTIEKA